MGLLYNTPEPTRGTQAHSSVNQSINQCLVTLNNDQQQLTERVYKLWSKGACVQVGFQMLCESGRVCQIM